MNIFSIEKEIRRYGPNYGVPCYIVTGGPGISYKNEALVKKLASMGLSKKQLVVFVDCLGEIGLGTLVEGLKFAGVFIEVEASSKDKMPGWFNKADHWIVHWRGKGEFNIGALRRGWDMILFTQETMVDCLDSNKESIVGKGALCDLDVDTAAIKGVRVYGENK